MTTNPDRPLKFHKSFDSILDTFRNTIISTTWLKFSVNDAQFFLKTNHT